GILRRLAWPSLHWGVEGVHPDAWPHIAMAAADAILSEFDVTERGEGGKPGECTARHPGTRLQCVLKSGHRDVHTFSVAAHPPITLPSVEDVARALAELNEDTDWE